ncbi:DNA-binding SARP family transcriptional activator/Flp pilus assembly protein TadD [Kibdelosporangium banguiense]|uniref:DNA-binding SARP family transcriptional activator/Flp pilus assembly protein TadD n=1 Tax=Kibdelosporangium banguiense TaxID=1365924 RepID=A0ABS4TYU6_9PSEU|nr:BTAD domain-containing putative transcriptional regulator [Kibdelosporangium banguiense]MBP2329575.1 DNA-binding SARP family transcriptional activator/Flp pilus assembly protein TadD [Kibdelosporangium banguiense]
MPDGVDIRLLGPVEVTGPDGCVVLHGGGQRTLIARLALHPGETVSRAALIDALWPERAPPTATKTLNSHLARLRRQLRDVGLEGVIATRDPGYVLLTAAEAVDAVRFENMTRRGRYTLAAGDAATAAEALRAGLGLWRGDVLADCRPGPWQRAEATRLDEARLAAAEDLLTAELALGGHLAAVGTLESLVARYPFRERLWELLLLALYRSGRQADALAAFQRARTALVDELGIEPGHELRRLDAAVLAADPALELPPYPAQNTPAPPAPRGPAVPRQLPADNAGFTGRGSYLQDLDALLLRDGDRDTVPRAVVISAIAGTAGIGKTTLAVHWAHRIADRFPDGQLHVNLRGFDPQTPVEAGQALDGFLHALGVDLRAIPSTDEAKAALYRSQLADRRMLIVLDNARDTDHVRPLLPASPTCVVIITSRNRLDSLAARDGAHRLILDLLTTNEAVALLTTRLGHQQVAAEPDAVTELTERCARLPLALSIAAARATTHPRQPLSRLVDDLSDERARLDTLDLGDTDLDLRAVFSWSYHTLTPPAARLFRLLSVQPGPDISLPAAANLVGIRIPSARGLLTELTRAHLLDEHIPDRYRFHDLLRAYAGKQAAEEEPNPQRHAATHRVLDYYLHTSLAAARILDPHWDPITAMAPQPGVTPGVIPDDEQAWEWFTAEHATLLAAIDQAARTGFDIHAWQLPWTLYLFLDRQGYWRDVCGTWQTALAAAHRLGDRAAQARAHRVLGQAYAWSGLHDDALPHHQRALALHCELDDRLGQARTHHSLGWAYERQGHYAEALPHAQHALDLFRATGHRAGEARALSLLGQCHAHLGHPRRALTHCHQALDLLHDLNDRDGEAVTLIRLGDVHHHLGQYSQAITHYQQALDHWRDVGDRPFEGWTLTGLGDTHLATGNHPAARAAWQQALTIFEELGYPDAVKVRTKLDQLMGQTAADSTNTGTPHEQHG